MVTLDEILNNLSDLQKETLQNLRALIKQSVPESVELIKQGNVTYKLGEKDFAWISVYGGHVDLEFAMGASLASSMLKSRGVARENSYVRHVEVEDFSRQKAELTRLLSEATSVGFEHCPSR